MKKENMPALYELQQIDIHIAAAQKALAGLDDGSALKKLIRLIEAELNSLSEQLRSMEAEQRDAEMSLQTIETKKKNYQRRLYEGGVTNPKELESMEKEIAMLERNQDNAETRVLELIDRVQEQEKKVNKMRSALSAKTAELSETTKAFNEKSAGLSERISELTRERTEMAAKIDPDSLNHYESSRQRLGGIAIGKVEDNRCDACHVSLTPFVREALRREDEVPRCESCGRFLYLP